MSIAGSVHPYISQIELCSTCTPHAHVWICIDIWVRLLRLRDEDLGGAHRVLPRRTSLAVNASSPPRLVFLPGKIPALDVCSRNRTAQMGQVQVQCREHNTRCFVLRNVRLEGAGSNQQLSLSLRCPLSLRPARGHHDRPSWSACLSIETAPGTNKNGPITGPMKRRGSNRPSYLLLSPLLSIV